MLPRPILYKIKLTPIEHGMWWIWEIRRAGKNIDHGRAGSENSAFISAVQALMTSNGYEGWVCKEIRRAGDGGSHFSEKQEQPT